MSEVDFKTLAREMSAKSSKSSSVLLLTVATLISVAIVWASITEVDSVVRGSGKTISAAKNQLVQSSEPGVIRFRYVSEGDVIKKGQPLFDIDPIDAKTQLDQAQKRFASLSAKEVRLQAEVNRKSPEFSNYLLEVSAAAVATELALYRARLDDLNSRTAILEQRRVQKLNEIEELKINYETSINGLELIRKEISTLEPLVKSGLAAETRLIALRRDEEASVGSANSAESGQQRLQSGLVEIDEQLKAEEQLYLTNALTDLSAIEGELSEISARIPALESRVERTSVSSLVDGVVNRVNYVTEGAYVSTGDILLEIVPTGSDIIVEAKINPKDIADIITGQDVKIALTAYDANRYGRIDGKVLSISADAINDGKTSEQFYQIDVSMTSSLFESDGSEVLILPGMVAQIDVLSGKRTILDYFWQPLAKTKDRALRD